MADGVGPRMTATELMVKAMESFSEFEPENVVVVYRGGCGCVVVHANMPPLEALGLVEVAKATMVQGMLHHEGVGALDFNDLPAELKEQIMRGMEESGGDDPSGSAV
jgi:hypothetical protein